MKEKEAQILQSYIAQDGNIDAVAKDTALTPEIVQDVVDENPYVEDYRRERARRLGITEEYILQNVKDIAEDSALVPPRDRLKAFSMLGEYLHMFSKSTDKEVQRQGLIIFMPDRNRKYEY